jgi:hypothetical protein
MASHQRYHSFAAVLVLAWVAVAPPARADVAKAAEHFDQGTRLYQVGEYARALAEFKAGHIEDPDPSFLYNIAQCHRQLGQSHEAVVIYRRFLSLSPDSPMRADIERKIRELEDRMRYQAVAEPPARSPAVVATAPPAGVAGASPPAVSERLKPAPAVREPTSHWPLWLGGALAVAFAGGATGLALSTNRRFNDLREGCGVTPAGCSQGEVDEIRTRGWIINGLFALAGASALATGIGIYVSSRQTALSVALTF